MRCTEVEEALLLSSDLARHSQQEFLMTDDMYGRHNPR
jgi:hypothetical protein